MEPSVESDNAAGAQGLGMDDGRLLGVSLALFCGLLPVADICGNLSTFQ